VRVVYVAHPLGSGIDRERNRINASKWCAWLAKTYGVAPVADWITLSGQWDESPENRDLGLRIDVELVKRCDEIILVGGRVSPGMAIEAEAARTHGIVVVDLTHLGYEVPGWSTESAAGMGAG
jgi:hypothetical protein